MGNTQARQGLVHSSIRDQGTENKNTLISSQFRSCKTGLTSSLDTAPPKRLTHCNAPMVPKQNLSLSTSRPSRLDRCTPRTPNGREAGIRLETCKSQRAQLWARREANFYGTCWEFLELASQTLFEWHVPRNMALNKPIKIKEIDSMDGGINPHLRVRRILTVHITTRPYNSLGMRRSAGLSMPYRPCLNIDSSCAKFRSCTSKFSSLLSLISLCLFSLWRTMRYALQ